MLRLNIFPASFTTKFFVDQNGCWIWTGYFRNCPVMSFVDELGVARVWNVTSWIYFTITGRKLIKKSQIQTTCGVDLCVNPAHLVKVSGKNKVSFMELGRLSAEYRLSRQFCANGHFRTPENRHQGGACKTCQADYRKVHKSERRVLAIERGEKKIKDKKEWDKFALDYLKRL